VRERPKRKKETSSAAYRSGLLDIVKKGYARDAEQLYLFCSGRPQASCREGLAQARHEALVLFGSECAYRTLQIGFISMQLVFL
jgi:hypothetical protein